MRRIGIFRRLLLLLLLLAATPPVVTGFVLAPKPLDVGARSIAVIAVFGL